MSKSANPFRYFNSSTEVIRLVVMMYVRCPLRLRNVEDLLFERGMAGGRSRGRDPRELCQEKARQSSSFGIPEERPEAAWSGPLESMSSIRF